MVLNELGTWATFPLQRMHLEHTRTVKVYYVISMLPDEVREDHLDLEKTWKAIPSYTVLHLLELDSPRPLQH
jgi:hypothetical protein